MKTWFAAITATLLLNGGAAWVHGGTITYAITDIGTSTTYVDMDTTKTFTGTGYVGMYGPSTANGASFAHMLGLEKSHISRTQLQVDTSGLAGASIQSAVLSFMVVSGSGALQSVTATSFTSNGVLGYDFDAPNTLGTAKGSVRRSTVAQSINVTSLLSQSVASGSSWFALNLRGTYYYQYTWAWDLYNNVVDPDAAEMRLTVDYTLGSAMNDSSFTPDVQSLKATSFTLAADPTVSAEDWGDGNTPSEMGPGGRIANPEPTTLLSAILAIGAAYGLRRKLA